MALKLQSVAFLDPLPKAPPSAPALGNSAGQPSSGAATAQQGASPNILPVALLTLSGAAAVRHVGRQRRRVRATRTQCAAVAEAPAPAKLGCDIADEEALRAKNTFAIKPDDLIKRCKEVVARGVGTFEETQDDLAESFVFVGPVIGPITKKEYIEALGMFKIGDAFPDLKTNFHGFYVDPFEPDRVWFRTRKVGTNTEPFMNKPASGAALEFPPESHALRFNAEGKVTEYASSYPIDRRSGNTGGLGGAFGFFYGTGRPIPIPECKPYKTSWQFRCLQMISRMTKKFQGVKMPSKE